MQPDDQNPTDQSNEATPLNTNITNDSVVPPTEATPETLIQPDQVSTVTEAETPVTAETEQPAAVEQPTTPPVSEPVAPAVAEAAPEQQPTNTFESTPAAETPNTTVAAGAGVVAAAAATSVGSAEGSKKSKKKLWLIGGIVAALLILAGGVGAYFGVFIPNHPQKIAGDALGNTINSEKLKSTKFEGEVAISGGEISKTVSSIGFEGAVDMEKEAVDLKVSVNTAVTKVNLDLRSTDGKSAYVRLSGLNGLDQLLSAAGAGSTSPESAAISQFAPLLSQVNDKWFVIDESLFKQVAGSDIVQNDEKITNAEADQIGKIYEKHQFVKVDKKLADEDIHGVPSYHLQATIDKDKLKAFMEEVKAANIKGLKVEQKDIDEVNKVDFSKYPFEMWVSKNGRFITQLSTSFEDKGTTYKLRMAFKDVNQPVNVEKPADAHSILELLSGFSQPTAPGRATANPVLMGL